MAIFTAIGGLIAGAIGLGSAALFGMSVGSLIGGALAFGTQLALTYRNRPKKRTYTAVQGQREYGARVPAWTLYGTGKVAGHHIYYAKWGKGNKFNADVFVLANGWCDGLEPEIHFYGEKHTMVPRTIIGNEVAHYGVDGFDNLISIRFYDGRPGQGPDTKLVADTAALGQNWKSTSVCAGMAYVVVEREWSSSKFDKGQPEFEFVLRGLRLYDPRKDSTVAGGSGAHRINDPATWEFSKNPALQRINYQLGLRGLISNRTLIGEGKSLGQLDLGSYFAAMNVCDTPRNGKPTYQAALVVTADDDHTEVLKEFDDAMAGYGMNRRGLSGVIAGAPQVPVLDIGPDDLDMGRPKSIRRRKSAFDLYNHIGGQFTSPEANWNPESLKPVTVNLDVAADGRVRQTSNDFLQVTDPDIAQYLLQIRYRQNRKGGSATIPVSRRAGFRVQEGEWVTYAGLTWLVTNWSCDEELRVTLTLAETGSDVYSSDGIEPGPIVIPPTPLVNPSLLSTVQDFDVEAGMITGEDGYEQPVLRFTWSPPEDPTITRVRFQYQIQGSSDAPFEDATDDVEAGEYITTKSVMSGKVYVARATIVTVPDRFKTWTGWETTATATGRMAVTSYLKNVGEDVYATLERMQRQLDDQAAYMRLLAEGSDEVGGRVAEERYVARRFRDAAAVAMSALSAEIEVKARVYRQPTAPVPPLSDGDIWIDTDDDNFMRVWSAGASEWQDATSLGVTTYAQDGAPAGARPGDLWIDTDDDNKLYRFDGNDWVEVSDERIAATASALSAVQAAVGDISGNGLWKMEVVAGSGDVVVRLVEMMRATVGSVWVETGRIMEAGFTDADPDKPFSNYYVLASKFGIIDPNDDDSRVALFATIEGKTYINVALIGHLTADQIDVASLMASDAFVENLMITDSLQLGPNVVVTDAITIGALTDSDNASESNASFVANGSPGSKRLEIEVYSRAGLPILVNLYCNVRGTRLGTIAPFQKWAGASLVVNGNTEWSDEVYSTDNANYIYLDRSIFRLIPTVAGNTYTIEYYAYGTTFGGVNPVSTADLVAFCNKA